jgi:hypothetical protein
MDLGGSRRGETRFDYFRCGEPYGFTWSPSLASAAAAIGAEILTQDDDLQAAMVRHQGRLLAVCW